MCVMNCVVNYSQSSFKTLSGQSFVSLFQIFVSLFSLLSISFDFIIFEWIEFVWSHRAISIAHPLLIRSSHHIEPKPSQIEEERRNSNGKSYYCCWLFPLLDIVSKSMKRLLKNFSCFFFLSPSWLHNGDDEAIQTECNRKMSKKIKCKKVEKAGKQAHTRSPNLLFAERQVDLHLKSK